MGGPCSVRVSVYFWPLQGVAPGPLLMISIELLSASSVERSGFCRLFSPLFYPTRDCSSFNDDHLGRKTSFIPHGL